MNLPQMPDLAELSDYASAVPAWAATAAVSVAAVLVVMLVLARGRATLRPMGGVGEGLRKPGGEARKTAAAAGPLAFLGACGMLVSLYGLYGFATGNMQLPVPFAVPFMAIWDVAEAVCFVSLYRSAAASPRWTRPMLKTRRTAWALVAASAAMNAAHAPGNWIATLAFAAVPVASAKLIEHELDRMLAANAEEEEEEARPGLVNLFRLGYQHFWANTFAKLGLDAALKGGRIQQDARIRRAAAEIGKLKRVDAAMVRAHKNGAKPKELSKVRQRFEKAESRAGLAVDVAGIAGDTPKQLHLARHLATRGRLVDLARMDVRQPLEMLSLLEDLAIVPSAAAIESGARAAEAERRREEAEAQAQAALTALTEAQDQAEQVQRTAAEKLAAAEQAQAAAQASAEEARSSVEAARDEVADLQKEKMQVEGELASVARNLKDFRTRLVRAQEDSRGTAETRDKLDQDVQELATAEAQLKDQVSALQRRAADAQAAIKEAETNRSRIVADEETMNATVRALVTQAKEHRRELEELAKARETQQAALARLQSEHARAAQAAEDAREAARASQREAERMTEVKRAAGIALEHAREELLDALTAPEDSTAPRWTSPAKVRGWELYLHTVHTTGTEPTDQELAGEDRDPSTARKWLPEFRAELARRTAAALPSQVDAHDRTTDRVAVPA